MARKSDIRIRRSAVAGAVPSVSDLNLGELALNTYDGKLYAKKSVSGTDSIVELSGGGTAQNTIWNEFIYSISSTTSTISGNDDNGNSLAYLTGAIQVFVNGVLQDPNTDYSATSGSTVTLTNSVSSGDHVQIAAFSKLFAAGDMAHNNFSGNGSATQFTLGANPGDENNTLVFIDGVYQNKDTYSVSGTTLTFSTPPANGTSIDVSIGTRNVSLGNIADLSLGGNLSVAGSATLSGLSAQNSESTTLMINGSNVIGTRELGSNAFTSNLSAYNTANLTEGTNLYYTDARVSTRTDTILNHSNHTNISVTKVGNELRLSAASSYGDSDVESYLDTNGTTFPDNVKAQFGGSNDLQIYHNGSNSYIDDVGTGALNIRSSGIYLEKANGAEVMASFIADGAATLYHNASVKLATTSTGIDVTGEVKGDSLDIDGAGDISGNLAVGGNITLTGDLTVNGSTTTLNTATLEVEDLNIVVGKNATTSAATNGAGLTFGAWSSGTIPRFEWDHSNTKFFANYPIQANLVGNVTGTVSTLSNHDTADLSEGTNLYYTDARVSTRVDTILNHSNHTNVSVSKVGNELRLVAAATYGDSDVESYLDTNGTTFPDNIKAQFGTGNDLFIEHDSNNSVIRNTTGNLYIQNGTSGSILIQPVNNEASITALANGAVELYYDNVKKLETTSTGIKTRAITLDTETTAYATDASLSYYSSTNGVYLNGAGNNGWLRLNASGTSNDSVSHNLFGTSGGNYQSFKTNSAVRMIINSAGNVNIGTDHNPNDKLTVQGARILVSRSNDDSSIAFANNASGAPSGAVWAVGRDYSDSEAFVIAYGGSGIPSLSTGSQRKLKISTSGAVTFNNAFTFPTSDGTAGYALKTDGSGNVSWGQAGGNAFSTIAISGQSSVVADQVSDTLTLVGTNGVGITTNAGTDTITIDGRTSYSPFTTDVFTTSNASTTAFTLSVVPSSEDNLIVFVEGVYQNKNSYVLSSQTLTLDSAPLSGAEVVVHIVGDVVSGVGLRKDNFTGNGSTTAFTLGIDPLHENNTFVYFDGVYQEKSEYSVSGTTLTFTTAPANGDSIEVIMPQTTELQTPSTNSINAVSQFNQSNIVPQEVTTTTVTSTSATTIASHSATTYRTIKYLVQCTQGTDYHSTEIQLIHDGTTCYITEYGTLFDNAALGTFDASISSGNILLQITAGSASSMTVKVLSSAITL